MGKTAWLTVGRITGVHGLAGNLKVWSHAQSPDTFAKGQSVRLVNEGETQGPDHTIARASAQKKGILLTLETVTTRQKAETLVGKDILMKREALPEPEADTWYWHDLMGLSVKDTTLGEIGFIDRLFPTGADDILVVKNGDRETLIPLNRHFVSEVDIGAGLVSVSLPDGFILD